MTYHSLLKYGLPWAVVISLGVVTATTSIAEQEKKAPQAGKPAAMQSAVIYKPPLLEDAVTMEDGDTRDTGGEAAILQVLAPDHTGLTLQAQPTLYWYTRTPVATRFEIAPVGKDKIDPLLEVEAGNKKVAGIQQLDLGDHDISLRPEVTYQWSVTQVPDEDSQSRGVIASGLIERMEPGEGLSGRIKNSRGTDLVDVYASEGIWYDLLGTISTMIDESPEDKYLAAIRASLLDQIGMHTAAGK